MADEAIEQTFAAPRDTVWQALSETVEALRYKDIEADPDSGTIEFRTGLSLWSWRGQQMTATVRQMEPGSTVVSLTGSLALKAQVTSWGEKKRVAQKVLDIVESRLSTDLAPGVPPTS